MQTFDSYAVTLCVIFDKMQQHGYKLLTNGIYGEHPNEMCATICSDLVTLVIHYQVEAKPYIREVFL